MQIQNLIGFVGCLLVQVSLYAQSNYYYPIYFSGYYQNFSQITPAYVPTEGRADFTAGYKSMLGAFRKVSSYYFTGAKYWRTTKDRIHTLRGQFYNEREGSYISTPRAYANYAFLLPLSEELEIYAGVSLGMTSVFFSAPTTTQTSYTLPDGALGLGMRASWFELGGAGMQIFNASFAPLQSTMMLKRHGHVYLNAWKEWPSEWGLKGYTLARFMPGLHTDISTAGSFTYRQQIELGASVRNTGGLSVFTMLGIESGEDKLQLLLNYNTSLFGLIPAWQSNIEVGLSYLLN